MIKIAFIIPSLTCKGPVVVLHNIIRGLVSAYKNEICPTVYYFDDCEDALTFNCPVEKISFHHPVKFEEYDIIHAHCFRADRYVAKWRRKIKKARIITTIHQDTYQSFKYIFPSIVAYAVTRYWLHIQNKFDVVTTISQQIQDQYANYLSTRVVTLYNGIDIEPDQEKDDEYAAAIRQMKRNGYKTIGTYAYVVERKGIDQIIHVLHELPHFALIVIGDGPYKQHLSELVGKLQLQDRVLFLPHIAHPYLYMDDIDIYCMPSYSEGFGLAMAEAAMVGKAVVCSDLPSFREIFPGGEACFFELRNKHSLIKALQTAYENRVQYGELCKARVEQNFTCSIMVDNYVKLYRQVISKQ